MHWNRKSRSARRLASRKGHPSVRWPQRRRRRRSRIPWGSLGIVTREATDKLRVRLTLNRRIDCHGMERLQKIIVVTVAATSGRTSLGFARVHGGSGSSGTPHSRVPLWARASMNARLGCLPLFAFDHSTRFLPTLRFSSEYCARHFLSDLQMKRTGL